MTITPYGGLAAVAGWLQACAAGLRVSTVIADDPRPTVLAAVHRDPDLTVDQRLALEELYAGFTEVNRGRAATDPTRSGVAGAIRCGPG